MRTGHPKPTHLFPTHSIGMTLACLLCTSAAHGQLFDRPVIIRNARIVTMDGPVIERGTVMIKGGRIDAIGPKVKAPFLATTIDADGKTVTPGLIDSWSALGHLGGSPVADPTSSAWDAFDRYDRKGFREALRHGVTTLYLGPGGGPGVCGTGVVAQLVPQADGGAGKLIAGDSALAVNLGSHESAIARAKTFSQIRGEFRKALDYRQALEDYEEDLKEYLEKLEERRKKEEAEKEPKEGEEKKEEGEKTPPEDKPKPKPEDEDDEDEPEDNGKGAGLRALFDGQAATADDDDNGNDKDAEKGDEKPEKKDEEKKEEELKKPERPKPDRKSEVLLKAIDHELPLRIEAHRSEDILNALELSEEFNLDIILEGATDAYLVVDKLAEADVPVILGPVVRTHLFENNEYRRHTARNAAALTRAGVSWTIGSGADDPTRARFVGMNAQLAFAHGAAGDGWLAAVTKNAARILSLSKRIGRLARGMQADLVVWTGDPSDPASTVDRVYVAGKLVYVAPRAQAQGGGS